MDSDQVWARLGPELRREFDIACASRGLKRPDGVRAAIEDWLCRRTPTLGVLGQLPANDIGKSPYFFPANTEQKVHNDTRKQEDYYMRIITQVLADGSEEDERAMRETLEYVITQVRFRQHAAIRPIVPIPPQPGEESQIQTAIDPDVARAQEIEREHFGDQPDTSAAEKRTRAPRRKRA